MAIERNTPTISIEYKVNFKKRNGKGKAKPPTAKRKKGSQSPPYITRLLALAHHLHDLINKGIVHDYADIARLSGLSRARVTQIMNLILLAPQIQEEILKPSYSLFPCLKTSLVEPITKTPIWKEQLRLWDRLKISY